ncbi:MAG: NAD-dependent epimerase/dehydratase family protein [Actinobacteria bacterium]|nr:NAD-dependent epimerase/dehydratase family protein [Actinomycetota bacterium]
MIGSHLVDRLLLLGRTVIGMDNLATGQIANLGSAMADERFSFVEGDVTDEASVARLGDVGEIFHLASPASPSDFETMPIAILRAGSIGTMNVAASAIEHGARLVLSSTSEVYGDPEVHPQHESYLGNVHTMGPRSCYDESKRFGEAVVATHARHDGLDAGIARIFNTYGPRMRVNDGRVVPSFVVQALRGEPLTVQGDGSQTRSFCHVDDQVRGLLALMASVELGPINIGNPDERSVLDLAKLVIELTASPSAIEHRPLPQDDPTQRCPDIFLAEQRLGWRPLIGLREGLGTVVEYFSRTVT